MEGISWLSIFLPISSIIISVFVTVYTVNNRIRNENRQSHMPYLSLDKIESIDFIDKFNYHLTPVGNNFREKYPNFNIEETETENDINIKLIINNIGYGVASNIKFYDLLTGEQIHGTQASNREQNQRLFTTLDIAAGDSKKVQARIINFVNQKEDVVIEDKNRILCIYQDLNKNTYDFVISINIKYKGFYDFSAYQRSSHSYKRLIKKYKKEYSMIEENYISL